MINTILICIAGIFASLTNMQKQLIIIDREMYVKYDERTVISNAPVIIVFNGAKYFMQSKEVFDQNGEISQAMIIGDVGYTTYSRREIFELKGFLKENSFSHFIKAVMVNNKFINVNSTLIPIKKINKGRNEIFYGGKDKGVIYRIVYK
jgi:hypothetical protein